MSKITIAIPVYNGKDCISKAVESSISQDCKFDYEILVVNNNSSDGTLSILSGYSSKIRIISNQKTLSMYDNHNICLKESSGDYVLFCHADDVLKKNALSILNKEILTCDSPDKFVIWGRSMFRDFGIAYKCGGGEINQILSGINSVKPFLYGGLTPSGTCYSRQSMLDLGGFVKCSHRLAPSDWVTMILLALHGFEFKMIDRIYFYRNFASTLVSEISQRDICASLSDAIFELNKIINIEKIREIIDLSQELRVVPLPFYSGCYSNSIESWKIKKIIIKKIIKNPLLMQNVIIRKILFG